MQHRHLNGLVVGAVFIVAAGCVQDSVRSAPRPHAMAAAENAYPAVPSSSPKPWKRFALEQGMGATCSTRSQRSSSGRSALLPADECIGPAPRPLAKVILSLPSSDLGLPRDTYGSLEACRVRCFARLGRTRRFHVGDQYFLGALV